MNAIGRTGRLMLMLERSMKYWQNSRCCHSGGSRTGGIIISKPVLNAIKNKQRPVVALESTIITHGMPFPANLETALEVEDIVRREGCVPATVAVIDGEIIVGLTRDHLQSLAESAATNRHEKPVLKVSRRDLPVVTSKGLTGGTTVSATMVVADLVGISVFVTGGIGGVHRGYEHSLDASTDLFELSRSKVAVVCAGVKSILDIGKTLEYLETLGVPVISYNGVNGEFPAFLTATSGHKSPHDVMTPEQAAQIINSCWELGLDCGVLIAVPIHGDTAIDTDIIENAIQKAVETAEREGVRGKDVTPFVLDKVTQITQGQSLNANIEAVKNNAVIGSRIARAYHEIHNGVSTTDSTTFHHLPPHKHVTSSNTLRPVIIGGTNVDVSVTLPCTSPANLTMDGSTYSGSVTQSFGGVGRNLADGLSRLSCNPLFISAIGQGDGYSPAILSYCQHMDMRGVAMQRHLSTAVYCALLNAEHNVMCGVGDFSIHDSISVTHVSQYEADIIRSPLVLIDGNLPVTTIDHICQLCHTNGVPVWFDPTDVHLLCTKPFANGSSTWKLLTYMSPNLAEFKAIARTLGVSSMLLNESKNLPDLSSAAEFMEYIRELAQICSPLLDHIGCVRIGLGKHGALLCANGDIDQPVSLRSTFSEGSKSSVAEAMDLAQRRGYSFRYYSASEARQCCGIEVGSNGLSTNCSGAGDTMVCGMVYGILHGHTLHRSMLMGLAGATLSVHSIEAIPQRLNATYLTNTAATMEISYRGTNVHLRDK